MKYKNLLLQFVACLSFLFFIGCSSPLIYSSIWQDKPVAVDGKATEWKIPLDYFDDKTKLNFSVSNDKSTLFFCIRATEDLTQKAIVRNGLQIWIDTTGGKRKQVGIQFPVIDRSAMTASNPSDNKHSQDEMTLANNLKKKYSGVSKQVRLSGFPNTVNDLVQVPNINGINVCLNWDSNRIMIYEVAIPFGTFYKKSLSPSDSAKVLGVSFSVTVPSQNPGGGGGKGGHGHGGGGGMGGGGGGGQMGGEQRTGPSASASGTDILTAHIKFHLSTQHL